MDRYDSYRFRVEWIDIPNHWNNKVKHLVDGTKYYQIGDGDHGSSNRKCIKKMEYPTGFRISWDEVYTKRESILSEEVHSNNLKSKLYQVICWFKTGNTIKIGVLTEEFGESNTTSSVGKISVDGRKYDRNFVKFSFQSEVLQNKLEKQEGKIVSPGFNNQLTEFSLVHPYRTTENFLDTK